MAKRFIFNKSLIGIVITLFATTLFSHKPRNISGTLVDNDGNGIVKTTVLLLGEDGTEVQRVETSKKRLGNSSLNLSNPVPPGIAAVIPTIVVSFLARLVSARLNTSVYFGTDG